MNPSLALLADLVDPAGATLVGQTPLHPKQERADVLANAVDEFLYGGAAGGGKTHWLIEYMTRHCQRYPGSRTLILRRVYPSLARSIEPRSEARLAGLARQNKVQHTWTFPNGSIFEIGSVQYANSVRDYQGAEYDVIGFEELTEFLEEQYTYMISRLRTSRHGRPKPHIVSTTNPGGVGHRWVKRRFIKPESDDIPEYMTHVTPDRAWRPRPTPDQPRPGRRVYLPATLEDNPTLTRADPGYVDRLNMISNRNLRKAMRTGDWDAIDQVEGALWDLTEIDLGRVDPSWVEHVGIYRRTIAVDPSDGLVTGDAYGVSDCVRGLDGRGYVMGSWSWKGVSVGTMAARSIQLYHEVGADALVVEKNHGGAWMVDTFRNIDPTINIKTVWASQGKKTRAEPVASLFEPNPQRNPMIMACMAGWHTDLEEELTTTTWNPGDLSPNELDALVWNMTELLLGGGNAVVHRRPINGHRLTGSR